MKTASCTFVCLLLLLCHAAVAQDSDGLFTRLQAISESRVDYFNVDGTEITNHRVPGEFTPKGLRKAFKRYKIKDSDLAVTDSAMGYPNYYIRFSEEAAPGVTHYMSRYFIGYEGSVFALTFTSFNKDDRAFHRRFTKLLLDGAIPQGVYENMGRDSINFAGRKIDIGKMCQFRNVNNMQCPYNGQMNWSVHKDSADAAATIRNSLAVLKTKKLGKFIAEDTVNVIFEGTPVKALRTVFDIKGVQSALVGMTGAKTLTIYFVWGPARNNFVSCVMSFWNNDSVTKSGLPALLDKVMALPAQPPPVIQN